MNLLFLKNWLLKGFNQLLNASTYQLFNHFNGCWLLAVGCWPEKSANLPLDLSTLNIGGTFSEAVEYL
ncbi:MAG: hypothetical protein V2I46_00275 [Bacteroides sp.]|jgi:hypothetical protein|nr:hypothetical protein [Bacteroides sp.]